MATSAEYLLVGAALVTGCTDEYADLYGPLSAYEQKEIESLSAPDLAVPREESSAVSESKAAQRLGQMLFFDTRYSPPNEDIPRSCDGCHDPNEWFVDAADRGENPFRNVTSVVNVAFYDWYTWDGSRDSLWSLALAPAEGPPLLGGTRLQIAHHIAKEYAEEYLQAFAPGGMPQQAASDLAALADFARFPAKGKPSDEPFDTMSASDQRLVNRVFANYGKALAAYMRRVVSFNSPFDRYVAGEDDAISDAARRGLRLFVGHANCIECHKGPELTDNEFHNAAVPVEESDERPLGRFDALQDLNDRSSENYRFSEDSIFSDHREPREGLTATQEDVGAYRTPSLRNVNETFPYMHAGQFATLWEVVEHYNEPPEAKRGDRDEKISALNLTDEEVDDIVEFLETLTGEEVPADLRIAPQRPPHRKP